MKEKKTLFGFSLPLKKNKPKIKEFNSFEEYLFSQKQENKRNFFYEKNKNKFRKKLNSCLNNYLSNSSIIKTNNISKNTTNITIENSKLSSLQEKEIKHGFFKSSNIQLSGYKKKKPIKIILKKNCIEKVIERNFMDSHKNKTFGEIRKIIKKYPKKFNFLTSNSKSLNKEISHSQKIDNIPSLKNDILFSEEKRRNTNIDDLQLIDTFLEKEDNFPLIKNENKKIHKSHLRKIGEEKAKKMLNAIRFMKSREYEDLDYKKGIINKNNLNRIIELIDIVKYKTYDNEDNFNDMKDNFNSDERMKFNKIYSYLGPSKFLKKHFKHHTILKYKDLNGMGFGSPRNKSFFN